MAEIKIEKKKPIWPWILLILIILGIIAYFIYANGDEDYQDDYVDDMTTEEVDTTDRPLTNSSVQNEDGTYGSTYDAYEAFAGSIMDSTRIAVDSSYTKKAFSNLASLVVRKADENNVEDSKALTGLREWSVLLLGIANNSTDMENFKNFKTACDKVAEVIDDIQEKNYPNLEEESSELERLADNVSASIPMKDQQEKINAFLQKSRDILQVMNK